MYIKKFFAFLTLLLLAACGAPQEDWFGGYKELETGSPAQIQYSSQETQVGRPSDNFLGAPVHRMTVLLPLSGDNAATGQTIRTSIETAVLQNAPRNLSVSFYDTESYNAINDALSENPEIIIGPVFSDDARALRNLKPDNLPVLSFTSDASSIGKGVMTMALMPTNSIETIVKEMFYDGIKSFIIVAPNTSSGKLMAGTAVSASEIYNVPVSGIFYYNENDSESIKNITKEASMNDSRVAANTKAREVLSDILTNELLTIIEKSSMTIQLENLSKSDTLGNLPYDAVLFLGTSDDTKNIASFLRYYGVDAKDVRFYGTAVWEGSDIANDFTMYGAKYATLPEISYEFTNLYEQMSGKAPNRLATFGYDAANMAIGMIYSDKSNAAYLLDPSGYIGLDGLFRLKPTGESERALQVVQLTGSGSTRIVRNAPQNFLAPIYNIEQHNIRPTGAKKLDPIEINLGDYVMIPERFQSKYKMRATNINSEYDESMFFNQENLIVLPEDTGQAIVSPDFISVPLERVNRTYIDSLEIEE